MSRFACRSTQGRILAAIEGPVAAADCRRSLPESQDQAEPCPAWPQFSQSLDALARRAASLGLRGLDAESVAADVMSDAFLSGNKVSPFAVANAVRARFRRRGARVSRWRAYARRCPIVFAPNDDGPDRRLVRRRVACALRFWRNESDPGDLDCFSLHAGAHMRQASIADTLGVSQSTVSRSCRRAREALRRAIARHGVAEQLHRHDDALRLIVRYFAVRARGILGVRE